MRTVSVIGTLTSADQFEVFGHPIKVSRAPLKKIGKRLMLEGVLCFDNDRGAYLQIMHYEASDKPDCNKITVTGDVLGVLTLKDHPRHGKSACIIMRQSRSRASKVLVTVPGDQTSKLDVSNLSTGQRLTITGYLGYHSKGLHILFLRREDDK